MGANAKHWLAVAVVVLAVNWALGAAHAAGALPLWTFMPTNIPFGLLYVWLERQWNGTAYVVAGHAVGDGASLALFVAVGLLQAALYSWLLRRWHGYCSDRDRPVESVPAS